MTAESRDVVVDVHLHGDAIARALAHDVRAGLTQMPKMLPPKWFYDDRGSRLFDEITRLPEYYPTRAERSILDEHATEIAKRTGADTLVELGSGTSEKTRLLLDALRDQCGLRRFVPFDVSEETLRDAAAAIADEYPGVSVHAVVGDFEQHLATVPAGGRRLVAFLGSTIGNFAPEPRHELLDAIAGLLVPGDALLLGTDLVKDPDRLVAAYDDAAGVTTEFNRNVLHVINRELDADFPVERFEHVARWDPDAEWIEMRLARLRRAPCADRAARPRRRVLRRRGAPHRDQREIPPRGHRGRARPRRAHSDRLVDRRPRRFRSLTVHSLSAACWELGRRADPGRRRVVTRSGGAAPRRR